MTRRLISFMLAGLLLLSALPVLAGEDDYAPFAASGARALNALTARLNEITTRVWVYSEASASANHYTQKARIGGIMPELAHDMDESWTVRPHSGRTCIRCEVETVPFDWSGWMFLNGFMRDGETEPHLNQGDEYGQGFDLTGAKKLVFWARGEKGGEQIQFFTAGFGRNAQNGRPTAAYPDSAHKCSTDFISLSTGWERYEIDVSRMDMSYICCGFGYVFNGDISRPGLNVFYLDDICFEGEFTGMRPLLASYETDDPVMQNTAFLYDNAMVAMAFLAAGRLKEAKQILDSFVYAAENDRWLSGRLRNAYSAGDIAPFPGWGSAARIPGWYDYEKQIWCEDQYQVGMNVGNTSFAALALLQYAAQYGAPEYTALARTLMDRVIDERSDGTPGFTAGYDGWPEAVPPVVTLYTYKSTEHNIDAYAAFRRLYDITGEEKYKAAADSALTFVLSMFDPERQCFATGTENDGVTPNNALTVLDTQVWTALALGDTFGPYAAALDTAEKCRTREGAYGFTVTDGTVGWWAEGTAFTALMYRERGEDEKAVSLLKVLKASQTEDGLFYAASQDDVPTGIYNFDGSPWTYSHTKHIVPAAWYILALYGFDPYTF